MKHLPKFLALTAAVALTSCAGLDRYERKYEATYDADRQSGAVSMTLRPIAPPSVAPNPVYAMDDATIDRIVRLIEVSARKNTPKEGESDLRALVPEVPGFAK